MILTVALVAAIAGLGAVVVVLATRLRGVRSELREALLNSRTEAETELRTRQAFLEDLELELLRVARTGRPACLIVLSANRSQGADQRHRVRELAAVVQSAVRSVDIAYRIAADEFALILPDTRARGGLVAAGRIEEDLLADGIRDGSFAAGVAEAGPGIDRRAIFRHAYCAYLAAGRDGASTVLAYSPELERGGGPDDLAGMPEIEPVDGSPA